MDLFSFMYILILYGISAAASFLIVFSIAVYMNTKPYPIVERYEEEEYFHDSISNIDVKFPSIKDKCSVNLSIVVPAYNEEERLPPMLDEALGFLEERVKLQPSFKYEIIIVSDGSRDSTVQVAQTYELKYGSEKVRCLELVKNRGKGGAVRMVATEHAKAKNGRCCPWINVTNLDVACTEETVSAVSDLGVITLGVFSSRGATILFADADGASKFEDLMKLEAALSNLIKCEPVTHPKQVSDKVAVVIGSRAHLEEESLATRSIFRNILMYGFHFLVWLFTVRGVKDTQCGFKLFTRQAAHICFESLHVNRWAFDVELLYIAQKLNIPIVEIPIRWTEIDGSKVTPVISWIQMGCDLALIWLRYTLGAWKIKATKLE